MFSDKGWGSTIRACSFSSLADGINSFIGLLYHIFQIFFLTGSFYKCYYLVMKTRLKKGEDFVSTFSYPTWEQLPELDLYLDQVLLYVNKTCAPVLSSSDKGLDGCHDQQLRKTWLCRKPDKKKYQRRQVARFDRYYNLKNGLFYSGDRFYLKFLAGPGEFRSSL